MVHPFDTPHSVLQNPRLTRSKKLVALALVQFRLVKDIGFGCCKGNLVMLKITT